MSNGGSQRRVEPDRPRLLAGRSELGYVDRIDRALPDEPEAVRVDEQRRQTELVHRHERQRQLDAYASMRAAVLTAFDEFLSIVGAERGIGSSIRPARRSLEQVGRRVVGNRAS